jgi:zinc transporter, ZIP family
VSDPARVRRPRAVRAVLALIPLILIGGLTALLLTIGPRGIFPGHFPAVEKLTVGRVALHPGSIEAVVTNGGPSSVTVAQVLVDDAYWAHTIQPSKVIPRLRSAVVTVPYPWVEGEPVEISLISSTGLKFSHRIEVATETPTTDGRFLLTFALVGIYIGVVPVALGMTWMPFLATLSRRWLHFFMAMTAGLLIFLGVETLADAIEKAGDLPAAFGGVGIVAAAGLGALVVIYAGARWLERREAPTGAPGDSDPGLDKRAVVATVVAAGIGLHNLGEGLAVGAAYRLGEIALGAFLVIGFAVHNTTEGIGIVSILGDHKTPLRRLAGLGLIAGGPTIAGAWIGAFLFSPTLATVFLAVAAGAIAEVVIEVLRTIRTEAPGGLAAFESLAGIAAGLAIMYLTGLLVTA